MKHFISLLLFVVLLSGCSGQTATEKMSVAAKNNIEGVKKSLKPECKTDETIALLDSAIASVDGMLITCEQQIEVLNAKIDKRNMFIAFEATILLLFAAAYLRRKL